jgi:tight adherence protein B
MAIRIAVALLGGIVVLVALVLLSRTNADKRRDAVAARLKALTTPVKSLVLAPEEDEILPDPWLKMLPPKLRARADRILGATGYEINLRTLLLTALVGMVMAFVLGRIVMHLAVPLVLLMCTIAALALPFQAVQILKSRHSTKFLQRFPDAIDLIVRAVRAGLPVLGSMEAAGQETPDPVGREFRRVIADTRIGLTIEEALGRAGQRIGLIEFNFFVASIQLQRESGGNLTETLATLSAVLRRRDELRAKTRALTAEARTSAMVLAALPFVTGGAIALISPGYFSPLFIDPNGGYILGGAFLNISMAMLSMRMLLRKATA